MKLNLMKKNCCLMMKLAAGNELRVTVFVFLGDGVLHVLLYA